MEKKNTFTITVYFLNGSIKEYNRADFVENFKHDTAKYRDEEEGIKADPMTGEKWAELVNSSDADIFDDMTLTEVQTYKLKLTSKRDVDHFVEVEAASRGEAYKIGYGYDFGYGFPDDVEIIG